MLTLTNSAKYVDASYCVSLSLAKKGKSFRTAETAKERNIEMAKAIGKNIVANKFKIFLCHIRLLQQECMKLIHNWKIL